MGYLISLHVNCCRDSAPAPDALPERRVDREHGHPPEEREQRGAEEDGEVREEPCLWRDGCAFGRNVGFVQEESGKTEDRDEEWSKDAS